MAYSAYASFLFSLYSSGMLYKNLKTLWIFDISAVTNRYLSPTRTTIYMDSLGSVVWLTRFRALPSWQLVSQRSITQSKGIHNNQWDTNSLQPPILRYIRAEWLSQTSILHFQSEIGWRLENQTGFWSHGNENLCRGFANIFQRWNKCLRSDPHASCHDSPCISDVLQRIKILLFLWQTSTAYKKYIDWIEWNLLTSTSFLILPMPLRVNTVSLEIGNAAEPSLWRTKTIFGQDG